MHHSFFFFRSTALLLLLFFSTMVTAQVSNPWAERDARMKLAEERNRAYERAQREAREDWEKFEREQRARREKERQANVAAAVRNEEVNARTRIINGKSVYLATVPARLASTDIEIVQQDSLFGLLQKGKLIQPMIYERIIGGVPGAPVVVVKNGKYGLLNTAGNVITQASYDSITGVFVQDLCIVKQNGLYGYVSKNGVEAIKPRYTTAENFYGEYAKVSMERKFGLISKSGNLVLKPEYEDVKLLNETEAAFMRNGKWGVVSLLNVERIAPEYEEIRSFGRLILAKRGSVQYLYNSDGKLLDENGFDQYKQDRNAAYIMPGRNKKWGIADYSGVLSFKPEYDSIIAIELGNKSLAILERNSKLGLGDTYTGQILIPVEYDQINKLKSDNNLFWLQLINGKDAAFFHVLYETITPDDVSRQKGYGRVKKDGKWGLAAGGYFDLLNPEFDSIAPVKMDQRSSFYTVTTAYSKQGKWGAFQKLQGTGTNADYQPEYKIAAEYDEIIADEYVLAKKGDKWGALAWGGKIIIPFEYEKLWMQQTENKKNNFTYDIYGRLGRHTYLFSVNKKGEWEPKKK